MRPMELELEAFGPYTKNTWISFESCDRAGLFLICGDTGAGKTTIFDGIAFALYDAASGEIRKPENFHSDYVDEKTASRVRLRFSHKGDVYQVTRIFRGKKQEAVLECPGEDVVTGRKPVNEKVKEILGLDYRQFKQISMIAQGEFLSLLLAKGEVRSEVFRKVFDTELYKLLSDRLKIMSQEEKERERLREERRRQVLEAYDAACPGDEFAKLSQEECGEKLREVIAAGEKKEKEGRREEQRLEKERVKALKTLERLQKENKELTRLAGLRTELEQTKGQAKEMRDLEAQLEESEKAVLYIKPVIEEWEGKKAELEEERRHQQAVREEKRRLERQGRLLVRERSTIEKEENLQAEIRDLERRQAELNGKREEADILIRLEQQQNALQEKAGRQIAEQKEAGIIYEDYREQFLRSQAGLLAAELREGSPCPVCGSLEHPKRAAAPSGKLDEQTLKKLDKRREEISRRLQGTLGELAKTGQEWQTRMETLQEDEKLAGVKSGAAASARIMRWLEQVQAKLEKRRGKSIPGLPAREEAEKKAEENGQSLAAAVKEEQLCAKKIEELAAKVKDTETRLGQEIKKQRFKSRAKAREACLPQETMEKMRRSLEKYQRHVRELQAQIRALAPALRGKCILPEEETKAAIARLQSELAVLRTRLREDYNTLEKARDVKRQLDALWGESGRTGAVRMALQELSDTANGTLSGKTKLSLERYVQSAYFRLIAKEANRRLERMSSGRYELLVKEEKQNLQVRAGLDLEVYDYHTGKVRSVRSLSGGESFQAALALALGVSGVIGQFAGGIRVETVFIDEGFGSLDEQSLETAVETLSALAREDCLVGIISHVPELRERIECRIEVEKERGGSRVLNAL